MSKKELSIFIDESGDFGQYQKYCPFYLVTFVFHEQQKNISSNILKLNAAISYLNIPNDYVHAGPIIRQENEYYNLSIQDRRKALNISINFIRTSPIYHHTFVIDRSKAIDEFSITSLLSKQIRDFIIENLQFFEMFTIVKVYYDNGQKTLSKILASVLSITIPCNVVFKQIIPARKYKLFQAADNICTLELTNVKIKYNKLSKYETIFFKTNEQFYRDYYSKIIKNKI